MSKSTIKYEYTEGCPNDKIGVLSQQSYKDRKGILNASAHDRINIEHGENDIILKAKTYDKILDKETGKIIERRDVKVKENEGLAH